MITYAERVCFKPRHMQALERAIAGCARVSAHWGNELRCHELARAVRADLLYDELALHVIDGRCNGVEHTWLCFADGVLLDVYVPGRYPAVQLIDPLVATRIYVPAGARADLRGEMIAKLLSEMRS